MNNLAKKALGPAVKKVTNFKSSWIAYMRTLCRQHNITFVFGGRPSTNGKVITLTNLPLELSSDHAVIVRSDALHEVGHVIHSDMNAFTAFGMKHGKFAQSLLNAIEDPWMEKRACSINRTAEFYLRKGADLVFKAGNAALGKDRNGIPHTDLSITALALCYYFSSILGWNEYENGAEIAFDNLIGSLNGETDRANSIKTTITKHLNDNAVNAKSTSDNADIALMIIHDLKDDLGDKAAKNPDEPGSAEGKPDGEPDGKSEGKPDGEPDGKSDGEPDGKADSKSGDSNNSKASSSESAGGAGSSKSPVSYEDVMEGKNIIPGQEVVDFSKEVEELSKDSKYDDSVRVPDSTITDESKGKSQEGAGLGNIDGGISDVPENTKSIAEIKQHTSSQENRLAAALTHLLTSYDDTDAIIGKTGSKIATGKLSRIPTKNLNIFKRFEEELTEKPAISILCDLSGSTEGECAVNIRKSVYLIASALESAEFNYEVLGFGSSQSTLLSSIKPFAYSLNRCKGRIGGMLDILGVWTPLLEASHESGMRLASQPNTDKFLFVLTDGRPSDGLATCKYLENLESMGVKPILLLIGKGAPDEWLKESSVSYVKIDQFEEIAPKFISLLTKTLS